MLHSETGNCMLKLSGHKDINFDMFILKKYIYICVRGLIDFQWLEIP